MNYCIVGNIKGESVFLQMRIRCHSKGAPPRPAARGELRVLAGVGLRPEADIGHGNLSGTCNVEVLAIPHSPLKPRNAILHE